MELDIDNAWKVFALDNTQLEPYTTTTTTTMLI